MGHGINPPQWTPIAASGFRWCLYNISLLLISISFPLVICVVTICMMSYNCKYNVLSALLNKIFLSESCNW